MKLSSSGKQTAYQIVDDQLYSILNVRLEKGNKRNCDELVIRFINDVEKIIGEVSEQELLSMFKAYVSDRAPHFKKWPQSDRSNWLGFLRAQIRIVTFVSKFTPESKQVAGQMTEDQWDL